MDETTEARIYETALRQTTMDQQHAMADALTQADTLLEELAEAGRYAHDATAEDRESDRLRLALALMRVRRGGFEDGALLHAWWRHSVDGPRWEATSDKVGPDPRSGGGGVRGTPRGISGRRDSAEEARC